MGDGVRLIPVEDKEYFAPQPLWTLLEDRPAENNISHKRMPSWQEHLAFVENHPYEAWYLIHNGNCLIGAIYLSKPGSPSVPGNEIGIDLFREFQGKGYGTEAVKLLMEKHGPRRYCANVSPTNEASQAMFKSLGFKLVQYTYALESE